MQYVRLVFAAIFMAVLYSFAIMPSVAAVAPPSLLVISEVETTGIDLLGNDIPAEEFVKLTNVSADTLDISGWKLYYINGNGGESLLADISGFVAPNSSVLIAHAGYSLATGAVADKYFSSGTTSVFGKTVGQIKLTNGTGQVADLVGWGSAVVAAPWPKLPQISPGFSVKRIAPGRPLFGGATDYGWDIASQPLTPIGGGFLADVCSNITGPQAIAPTGYGIANDGTCQPDSCVNIELLQVSVPDGYTSDDAGNCMLDIVPLRLSELLPNVAGDDTGGEFIELYNPTSRTIDLMNYRLYIGVNATAPYAFPVGSSIGPGEYKAFSNTDMKFTLVNSTGQVTLRAVDGRVIDQSAVYQNPADGESWALLDGVWQYTNQPTSNEENRASIMEDESSNTITLASCPAGKYRNPLTNRCRTIVADAAIFASCDSGQYRNPDTGRCKKVESDFLTPCKDGQYRSEETNRCRNIVAASVQKPCKDNQYRSEETNRCRALPVASVPASAFAVQPVKDTGMAFVGWWALGGVGLLAAGYGVWEWRDEIRRMIGQITSKFSAGR